ncbi:hypothetical protein MAR_029714 [Mya arenaria]|uniref:Uncharacterized protein n=1 Tax=Mya arenaria TaxID=6604 RepID=A0ABY7DKJ4_MYAAR|nr:hypothetical protein MAR_029714 [Mya arenaria]
MSLFLWLTSSDIGLVKYFESAESMTQDEDVDVETNDGKSLNRNPWKVEQTPQLPKVEPPVGQDELDEGVAGVLIVVLGGPEVVTGRLHLRLAPPLYALHSHFQLQLA